MDHGRNQSSYLESRFSFFLGTVLFGPFRTGEGREGDTAAGMGDVTWYCSGRRLPGERG